ncbi:hypothetical protein BDW69DRAFT_201311 [Aspergillus filifer]
MPRQNGNGTEPNKASPGIKPSEINLTPAPEYEPQSGHNPTTDAGAEQNRRKEIKRQRNERHEERSRILAGLRSGQTTLYLQEVPRMKASHRRAWNCVIPRPPWDTKPIIRNMFSGVATAYYHVTCIERLLPDLSSLIKTNRLKLDGWQLRENHDAWNKDWSLHNIDHQLAHKEEKPVEGCYWCPGGPPMPREPVRGDYFPGEPSPHVDKWRL